MSSLSVSSTIGVLAVLLALSSCAVTSSGQELPEKSSVGSDLARFDDGDQSLEKLIDFPSIDGDVLAKVSCIAYIIGSGQIHGNTCFQSEDQNPSFRKAVEKAIRSAEATPAIVNGKPRSTHLVYRVVFWRKNDLAEVRVYSNWGHDVARLGPEYEAPQRYTKFFFPRACDPYSAGVGFTSTMVIGADGNLASDVEVNPIGKKGYPRSCISSIGSLHEQAKYIPGTHNGRPVEATLVEPWGAFEYIRVRQSD